MVRPGYDAGMSALWLSGQGGCEEAVQMVLSLQSSLCDTALNISILKSKLMKFTKYRSAV